MALAAKYCQDAEWALMLCVREGKPMQSNRPRCSSASPTDAQLLARYRLSGSEEALSQIIQRHSGAVYSACLRILGDSAAAEDASQAAFLVLMRRGRTLPAGTVLLSWLYFTAQNAAREIRRGNLRRAKREQCVAQTTARSADSGLWNEVRPEIDFALGELPAAQRDAIVLRYLQGLSLQQAAQTVGCAEKTLEKRVYLALQKLRLSLTRRGVAVTAVALATFLSERTVSAAPSQLAQSITSVCIGKSAASAAALSTAQGLLKTMAVAKVKAAVLTAVLATSVCLPAGYMASQLLDVAPAPPAVAAPLTSTETEKALALPPDAGALRAPAQARSPFVVKYDFEDGRLPPDTTGSVVAGPPRTENRFVVAGEFAEDSGGICRVRFQDATEGLVVVGRERLELSFDYWAEENVASFDVFSWNATRQKAFGCVLLNIQHGRWTRVNIPMDELRLDGESNAKLQIGDVLQTLTIQTGQRGARHYVDNVEIRVVAAAKTAAPPK